MSNIEPKQQNLQADLTTPKSTLDTLDLEDSQNKKKSQESYLVVHQNKFDGLVDTINITIDQNAHLPITTTDDEAEHQKTQDVPLSNSHNAETSPSSQELILKKIHHELKCLGERMQKFETSIDSLRAEVADLKQQTVTTNSKKTSAKEKSNQAQSSNSNRKKLDFNAVSYLKEHGEDKLQEELKKKSKIELTKIIRSESIKIGKNVEHEDMVQEIISNTKRELKHGSTFLEVKPHE